MALNDGSLNDAGRDYYNKQFGARVQNIRKYGATAPSQRKAGCLGTGGAAGGGIFAVIVVIRIIAALAWVGSSHYDSSYNTTYDPPTYTVPDPPPQIDWQNNVPVDPPMDPNVFNPNPPFPPDQPIIVPPLDPPLVPPDDPLLRPDPPVVGPDVPPALPDPPAPAVPGDNDKPGGDDK